MIEQLKPRLVPKKEWGGEVWFEGTTVPLLVKYIFTVNKLSVQVHPNDAYARQQGLERGKTEMWHVLSAQPGAQVAVGFREPISAERMREAALSGEIEGLLEWHDARPGDTFFIPAGTVHAVGAGLVMCEIQQHSDTTYRLYDYGRPRELHLDHAMNVSDRGSCATRSEVSEGLLVTCEYFVAEKLRVRGELLHASPGSEMWIATEGTGWIDGEPFEAGQVFVIPEPQQVTLSASDARFLRVRQT